MISSVHITLLEEGALTLFDVAPVAGLAWHRDEHGSWNHSLIRGGRLGIPTNLLLDLDDLGDVIPPFPRLDLVDYPGTLAVASRPTMVVHRDAEGLPPLRHVVAGIAFLPEGSFGLGIPVNSTDDARHVVEAWFQNPRGMDAADMHPAIRDAFLRQMEHREAVSRALQRAKDLLLSCLTPDQAAELEAYGRFHLRVGDHTYRIGERHAYNVARLDEAGRPHTEFCVVSSGYVPLPDQILAQKLLLESDPDSFFRIANHRLADPPGVQVIDPAA